MIKGQFITLEGGEGGGKSTHIAFIRDFLTDKGLKVIVTREPGGTPLGEKIRSLLLNEPFISAESELLLMFAQRAQHLNQVILPALAQGHWVISDRFTDASYAYQGAGRGIDDSAIAMLAHFVQKELKPDLTLLFDVSVEIGMARIQKRGQMDRFETETRLFFERVKQAYLQQAERHPERIRRIDADLPIEEVRKAVLFNLERLLP